MFAKFALLATVMLGIAAAQDSASSFSPADEPTNGPAAPPQASVAPSSASKSESASWSDSGIPILPSSFPSASSFLTVSVSASAALPSSAGPFSPGTVSASTTLPSASSLPQGCRTKYIVMADDVCDLIASEYSITLLQLLAANPGVDADCRNLVEGEELCIPDEATPQARRSRFFRS